MPIIPTYSSTTTGSVISQPRATADTSVSAGLSSLGKASASIGTTLADIRDRSAIVDAQLMYKKEVAQYDFDNRADTDYTTMRDRRSNFMKDLKGNVVSGLSDRAKRSFQPKLDLAVQADEIKFNAHAFSVESNVNLAELEANKPILGNALVQADTDEEVAIALDEINTSIDAKIPYVAAGKGEEFRAKYIRDILAERALRLAEQAAINGETFDASKDFDDKLLPKQVRAAQSAFTSKRSTIAATGRRIEAEGRRELREERRIRNEEYRLEQRAITAANKKYKATQRVMKAKLKEVTDTEDSVLRNAREKGVIDDTYIPRMKAYGATDAEIKEAEAKFDDAYTDHTYFSRAETSTDSTSILEIEKQALSETEYKAGDVRAEQQSKRKTRIKSTFSDIRTRFKKNPWDETAEDIGGVDGMSEEAATGVMVSAQKEKGIGLKFDVQYFPTSEVSDIKFKYAKGTPKEQAQIITGILQTKGKWGYDAIKSLDLGMASIEMADALEVGNLEAVAVFSGAQNLDLKEIAIDTETKATIDTDLKTSSTSEVVTASTSLADLFPADKVVNRSGSDFLALRKNTAYIKKSVEGADELFDALHTGIDDKDDVGIVVTSSKYDRDDLYDGLKKKKTAQGLVEFFPRDLMNRKLTDQEYGSFIGNVARNSMWVSGARGEVTLRKRNGAPWLFKESPITYKLDDAIKFNDSDITIPNSDLFE